MTESYLTPREAASYLNMDYVYFRRTVQRRVGPAFVAISPRKKLFTVADLDAWKATWQHVPQQSRKLPCGDE